MRGGGKNPLAKGLDKVSFISKKSYLQSIALVMALAFTAGCGGSSSTSTTQTPTQDTTNPAPYQGQFVDSPVEGLGYRTATREGVTDGNGYFGYDVPNEPVTFFIGNQDIGVYNTNKSLHVYDMKMTQDDKFANKQYKVAQLLQTLDKDQDESNGIQLSNSQNAKKFADIAEPFNYQCTQKEFEDSISTHLLANPVSYVLAKEASDKQAKSLTEQCPIPNPILNGVEIKNLSCDNRKKVNFYKKNIVNNINQSINGYDLHISDFSKDEATKETEQAIENNPILSSLEAYDSLVESVDAYGDKSKQFELFIKSSTTLLKFIDAMVNASDITGTNDKITEWNEKSKKTQDIIELLSSGAECVNYLNGLKDGRSSPQKNLDKCVALVGKSLKIATDDKDKNLILQRQLEGIVSSIEALEGASKLAQGKTKSDVKKALLKTAAASSQLIGDAVVIHYIGTENEDTAVGIESFINDGIVTPASKIASTCYANPDIADKAKCPSVIAQEVSKSLLKVAIPSAFRIERGYYAIKRNEVIVAQRVLEELMKYNTFEDVYKANKIDLTNVNNRFSNLIIKIADDYGYDASSFIWAKLEKEFITGENNVYVDVDNVSHIVDMYLNWMENSFDAMEDSAYITLTATPKENGLVSINGIIEQFLNETNVELMCYTNAPSDHDLDNPVVTDIKGASSADFNFDINFPTNGAKGVVCVAYSKGQGLFKGKGVVGTFVANVNINLTNGLVAHYEFEGNANDSSGNGNHGTPYGGVGYVDGVIGQAGSFDGVDDYISALPVEVTTDITMSSWVNPKTQGTDGYTVGGIVVNGGDYEFAITSGTNTIRYALNNVTYSTSWVDTGIAIPLNQWSLVSITYNGSSIITYLNGVEVHRKSISGNMLGISCPLGVGARYLEQGTSVPSDGWYSIFNGQIDDLRIYNRALNESEIQELYNRGK